MDVDVARLPHWSRVAFAACCARRVQPLLARAWPEADSSHTEAIELAIALAERSAARAQPEAGLKEARLAAAATAGRAQIPHIVPIPLEDEEVPPRDRERAVIATLAAKVAEKAAETAGVEPRRSAETVREAYGFALDALDAAGQWGLAERLEADFARLEATIPRKPWWRFW